MKYLVLALAVGSMLLSGCTTTQQYAGGGAAGGAALGAVIGHQSGHRDKGALIGAVVGGLAGTIAGQKKEMSQGTPENTIVVCPACESRVDVSGFPPHSTVQCPGCKSEFTY